jgi:hypothetical protein
MPVGRSSTRPTLALTLAVCKAKHEETPKMIAQRGIDNEL